MTQKSYFHDGLWSGDASLAPYSAELYTQLFALTRTSLDDCVFDYLNRLEVTHVSAQNLQVDTGAALVGGIYCVSTATTAIAVPSNNSGYDRMDRVLMRVDWTDNSVVIDYKTGTPSSVAVAPTLVQKHGVVWEMPLARVYVPDGSSFNDSNVADEREFLYNPEYSVENMMHNSEFIATVGSGATGGPAMWEVNTPASVALTVADKFDQQPRGSAIAATISAAHPAGLHTTLRLTNQSTVDVTIRMLVEVTSGILLISPNGTAGTGTKVPPTGPIEIIQRWEFGSGDQSLELYFSRISADDVVFKVGQITVSYGLTGAPFIPKHETIIYGTPEEIVNVTTGSTGTYPYTLASIVDSCILDYVQALIVRLNNKDSGSAATPAVNTSIEDSGNTIRYLTNEVGSTANDAIKSIAGIINVVNVSAIDLVTIASGAATTEFQVSIIGITT